MQKTAVLIAGAGPTGLVLALWLSKIGVQVRIIDKAEKPGTTSRAIVMHARNLEFYRQLEIDKIAIRDGMEFGVANLWLRGKRVGRVPFGVEGTAISKYPFSLIYTQDRQEEMLIGQLANLGVHIERNTTLISYNETAECIRAVLRKQTGEEETCETIYLAGCDGAHSIVREQMGVGFPGGTYRDVFYVADLHIKGAVANGEMNGALDEADFLAIFPMKGEGNVRLVGNTIPDSKNKKEIKWEDVSSGIIRRLKMDVHEVRWFSTYKVHHRVASHFKKGNVFLLGDAGHIHSPVGGQGMNTGIGDAVNLAWKLGEVINGKAPGEILDTYETERIAFANNLVKSTDKGFAFITNKSFFAKIIRTKVIPYLLPFIFRFRTVRLKLYMVLSQIRIKYPQSRLSKGSAGKVNGGDRLPWVAWDNVQDTINDNYAALNVMEWQIHCYGKLPEAITPLCEGVGVPLHIFPWNKRTKASGLQENAVYVIRPDGYVGLADAQGNETTLKNYLQEWGIGKRD